MKPHMHLILNWWSTQLLKNGLEENIINQIYHVVNCTTWYSMRTKKNDSEQLETFIVVELSSIDVDLHSLYLDIQPLGHFPCHICCTASILVQRWTPCYSLVSALIIHTPQQHFLLRNNIHLVPNHSSRTSFFTILDLANTALHDFHMHFKSMYVPSADRDNKLTCFKRLQENQNQSLTQVARSLLMPRLQFQSPHAAKLSFTVLHISLIDNSLYWSVFSLWSQHLLVKLWR